MKSEDDFESVPGTYSSRSAEVGAVKKAYRKPTLSALGDVRSLTLGGSPGTGESGMPFNFQPLSPGGP